jgi:DNA ligase-1
MELKFLEKKWSVQLAQKFEPKRIKDGEWFSVSEKINGVRATYFDGKIYLRQGKEICGMEHILEAIKSANFENLVLDGELVCKNGDEVSDNENFRRTAGIVGSKIASKTKLEFMIFDILTPKEFENGESNKNYKLRMAELQGLKLEKPLKLVPILYSGTDQTKIGACLKSMISKDKEGVIINLDRTYKAKRNSGILKLKEFHTLDLKVKSVVEGTGKALGKAGSLVVDYHGSEVEVEVGTGFTDKQRKIFWQEKPIGRVIEVKYFTESENKKGGRSLQFPVFVGLCEVGKEVSYD